MRLGAQPFSWKWVLFEWEWKMISISKTGGWVSLGKKLEFKSSEMTKNVSITHKVERSFFCTLQFVKLIQLLTLLVLRIWLSLPLWKVQIVWLKKNLYMDIVALGFDHFMTSLSMVKIFSPSFVSLFVFFFLTYTDMFFFSGTHLRTCVRQVHPWILFYWTRFKIPWLKSQFVVMWINQRKKEKRKKFFLVITLIVFDSKCTNEGFFWSFNR